MSAVIVAHPAHVHSLGGFRHAHYWVDRGFLTVASASPKFVELIPIPPPREDAVRLWRPRLHEFWRSS